MYKIGFINGVDNVNWPRIEKLNMFRALALRQSDGLSLHLSTTESRKNLENPHGINERCSFNECIPIFHVAICYHQLRRSYSTIKTTRNPHFLDLL